jgi:hypothetical protein
MAETPLMEALPKCVRPASAVCGVLPRYGIKVKRKSGTALAASWGEGVFLFLKFILSREVSTKSCFY